MSKAKEFLVLPRDIDLELCMRSQITVHTCFCLNSLFWFSCKDDFYVTEKKRVMFTVFLVVWPTVFTVALVSLYF